MSTIFIIWYLSGLILGNLFAFIAWYLKEKYESKSYGEKEFTLEITSFVITLGFLSPLLGFLYVIGAFMGVLIYGVMYLHDNPITFKELNFTNKKDDLN